MSLLEQQNLMARLYMDEDLRRAFLSDPPGVAAPFGLSTREIEELSLIIPDEVEAFSESLLRKRMREVEKMLPLVRKALAGRFEAMFLRYAEGAQAAGEMTRSEDVLEFCRYLERESPGEARDAARFERARIKFFTRRRNLIVRSFDHDVGELLRSGGIVKRRTYYVWMRIGKKEYQRRF
jgi:hypothetical protein